ncbi:unnamed protein product [Laminaria digitata]
MTFTKLVDILAEGLTEDGGQFAVVPGKVFFKRDNLKSLKEWYNKNAKYNPSDIGVDLNETQVKIVSDVYTVRSVEEGVYSLSGCDIKIDQWQLLECRYTKDEKDNVLVTLENDLQKYILSLVAIYIIVWTSFVQFLLIGQPNKNGVTSVGTSGMVEDWSKRELSSDEKAILEGVAKMRKLSKLAFLNASVADTFHTLPVRATGDGHAGDGEATSLRTFASSEGSLCKLNFLGGLGGPNGADKTGVDLMDKNDGKLMIKMSAKKGEQLHGAYPSHINHVVKLLQYAYRLNRPISLHEAYLPIFAAERDILREHSPAGMTTKTIRMTLSFLPFLSATRGTRRSRCASRWKGAARLSLTCH